MDFLVYRVPKYSIVKFYVDNINHEYFVFTISKTHALVCNNFDEWKPLKVMKIIFLFHLKGPFSSEDIQGLSLNLSWVIGKMIDKLGQIL